MTAAELSRILEGSGFSLRRPRHHRALVLLEGLLSADNALVLAVPGRSAFRGRSSAKRCATASLAPSPSASSPPSSRRYMIGLAWVKLLGALYLLYLPIKHFSGGDAEARRHAETGQGLARPDRVLGHRRQGRADRYRVRDRFDPGRGGDVEQAVGDRHRRAARHPRDAHAGSGSCWWSCSAIRRWWDGAFIIIAWVGIKLLVEYLHQIQSSGSKFRNGCRSG